MCSSLYQAGTSSLSFHSIFHWESPPCSILRALRYVAYSRWLARRTPLDRSGLDKEMCITNRLVTLLHQMASKPQWCHALSAIDKLFIFLASCPEFVAVTARGCISSSSTLEYRSYSNIISNFKERHRHWFLHNILAWLPCLYFGLASLASSIEILSLLSRSYQHSKHLFLTMCHQIISKCYDACTTSERGYIQVGLSLLSTLIFICFFLYDICCWDHTHFVA